MRSTCLRYSAVALFSFFLMAGPALGDQACFTETELIKFLEDGPDLLQWLVEADQSEQLDQICRFPQSVEQYPPIHKKIKALGWQPQRFAYILSHLVVGYKASRIGSNGDHVVCKLQSLKTKIAGSPKLAPEEKKRLDCQIDDCLDDVQHTLKTTKDIPNAEKALMYAYRRRLQEAFKDRLPLRAINLPNLK